jgi:hypothetical protein
MSDPMLRNLQLLAVASFAISVLGWVTYKLLLVSGAGEIVQTLNLLVAP